MEGLSYFLVSNFRKVVWRNRLVSHFLLFLELSHSKVIKYLLKDRQCLGLPFLSPFPFSFCTQQYNYTMNIKKILTNYFDEQFKSQPIDELQRKNTIRLRNKHKNNLLEQNGKPSKHLFLFKPANQQANALAMKYVESHHPSIKQRVVRILSNHRQLGYLNRNETLMLDSIRDEKFCQQAPYIHKQSYSTIAFNTLKSPPEIEAKKMSEHLQEILKPCKISTVSLAKRSQTEYRRPKTRQQKSRTAIHDYTVRSHYKSKYSKNPLNSKQNISFTAWEFDKSEMQPFLD